jgi:lysophospholipase L1-like esterase
MYILFGGLWNSTSFAEADNVRNISCLIVLALAYVGAFSASVAAQTSQPATRPGPAALNPNLPTVWIIADSTASNGRDLGWGSHLSKYLDAAKVNVANRAIAGRSTRTFINEGAWARVLPQIKAGDFVLIQFGHNDSSPVDTGPARGVLPGVGEEIQAVTNRSGQVEMVMTFGGYLRKFINDSKAKGAQPILMSHTARNIWTDGKIERGIGEFPKWTAEVAAKENVPYVDFTNMAADEWETMGQAKMATMFPRDHTHTSAEGADFHARLVIAGLRGLKPAVLDPYLSEAGQAIAANAKYARR